MTDNSTVFKAAVIGCGRIAFGLDSEGPDNAVLTHTTAYAACPGTEVVGVCDEDGEKAGKCADACGAAVFTDAREMLETCCPDIVSICTPDITHMEMLALCTDYPLKAIWCEKPVGMPGQDPGPVIERLERRGCLLAVNYMRRWEPEHVKIGEGLRSGEYGRVDKVIACYSNGLVHNGSHFIDLLISWFGNPESWKVLGVTADANAGDPALDVRLRFPGSTVAYLLAGNVEHYSQDEVDVWTEKGRIRVTDYSRRASFQPAEFSDAAGKNKLTGSAEVRQTSYDRLMLTILESIVSALSWGTVLLSTGQTALETLGVCSGILDAWRDRAAEKGKEE